MIFSWLKKLRRRRILAAPFPESWLARLENNISFYALLEFNEKARLRDFMKIFAAEKDWEGCGGLEINDEIKLVITAQACLLVLGLKISFFDHVKTILVYPAEYRAESTRAGPAGTVLEGMEDRLGEAWYRGPVVLSWADALHGCLHPGDGVNVVFHEFAHQLDMRDGHIDGTPPLENREQQLRWQKVMTAEYDKLMHRSRMGRPTLFDRSSAEGPAEFFATATEWFFERPFDFNRHHPRLYALLTDYFHQDPAERLRRRAR